MAPAAQRPAAAFKEGQVEANGFRIRYLEAGQGNPVVILDAMTWGASKLHDTLAQTCRVVALELPRFGRSPANTRWQSARDLANTMAQAAATLVEDTYTLIGTAFGANVALWQTLRAPDKVEALILISPTAIFPTGRPAVDTPEEMSKRLFAHPENMRVRGTVDPAVAPKEHILAQWLKAATHDAEAESKLSEIQCATLVVFGLEDKMVAPEAARIYREKIHNCNVSIVYDAGHLIMAERPEALIEAVYDFVERRETFFRGTAEQYYQPIEIPEELRLEAQLTLRDEAQESLVERVEQLVRRNRKP